MGAGMERGWVGGSRSRAGRLMDGRSRLVVDLLRGWWRMARTRTCAHGDFSLERLVFW